jgi:mitochondrial-processing peptidase subunit beta
LDVITKYNLANSYEFFSASYSDTGLWETCLVSENLANLDDLMHFTLREWTRMSIVPTAAAEAECAKSQLKAEPSVLYLTLSAPKMVDL